MTELQMDIGAIIFELGIPCVLGLMLWLSPRKRKFASLVLGATCPFLFLYLACSASYFLNPDDIGNRFAFFAMWVMSFAVYVFVLAVAVPIGIFLRRPQRLLWRFLIGLSPAASLLLFLGLRKTMG